MIKLTSELIDSCRTANGGFTKAQIESLGLNPKSKWKKKAIGTTISRQKFKRFRELRDSFSKKTSKRPPNSLLTIEIPKIQFDKINEYCVKNRIDAKTIIMTAFHDRGVF